MELEWLFLIIPLFYYTFSLLFLCCPLFQPYRYKNQDLNVLLSSQQIFKISHRGGAFQKPQNTMQAFKSADPLCDMFQLDVHLTKDKHLVIHHDQSLLRTCGVDQLISQKNYLQLPLLQQSFQTFGNGPIKSTKNKIPLLKQLFLQFPTKLMNIQLKNATQQGIKQFDHLIREFKRQKYTIWGVAKGLNIEQINQNITSFYSAGEVLKIYLLFLFGLLPFCCIRHGILQIPLVTQQMKNLTNRMSGCKWCLIQLGLWIGKSFNLMSRLFIPHLKKRGILTFYWIVNEEQDFDTAISMGCSGIMTDQPTRLKIYLQKKKKSFMDDSL